MKARALGPKGKGGVTRGMLYLPVFLLVFSFAGCEAGKGRPSQESKADEKDGMIFIPAGEFTQGTDEEAARVIFHVTGSPTKFRDEKPKAITRLEGFYIDQYEVTHAQYKEFLQATNRQPPDNWIDGEYPYGEGRYPVTHISWLSARLYAEWAGKRLPTEGEWEKAARGSDGRIFPWGSQFVKGKANLWEEGLKKPQEVGKYPEDLSPYGVHDLAGNVMEWTDTLYRDTLVVVRGGSWANDGSESRADKKMISELDVISNAIGFRCVRSKAPSQAP